MADYNSSYTGAQIDAAVGKASKLPTTTGTDEGKVVQVDSAGAFTVALTVDSTPTQSSTNLITSGGVYTALGDKLSTATPATANTVYVYSAYNSSNYLTQVSGYIAQPDQDEEDYIPNMKALADGLGYKQNTLTTSSVSSGTVAQAIGFDSSNHLVRGAIGGGITNYEVISRGSSLPTATATSPDFVQYNGNLYKKTSSTNTPSTITDVTDTKWLFNDESLHIGTTVHSFNLSFYCQHYDAGGNPDYIDSFTSLSYGDINDDGDEVIYYDNTKVASDDRFFVPYRDYIEITGGTDATNATLISWLQTNATVQPMTVYAYELVTSGGGGGGVTLSEVENLVEIVKDTDGYFTTNCGYTVQNFLTKYGENVWVKIDGDFQMPPSYHTSFYIRAQSLGLYAMLWYTYDLHMGVGYVAQANNSNEIPFSLVLNDLCGLTMGDTSTYFSLSADQYNSKLDKVTSTASYNRLYGISAGGVQQVSDVLQVISWNSAATDIPSVPAVYDALSGKLSNPMTATNDLIVGGTVTDGRAAATRLAKGNNGELLGVNSSGNLAYTKSLPILTVAPIAANTDGLKIVVLSSDLGLTKYAGYLYIITGSN